MSRFLRVGWLGLFFFLAGAVAGWAAPRVAVMDFDNQSQYGGWRLGSGAADILTTEMVKTGKFDMFERERLSSVIKEQNLGASGRVDPATAARIGKIIGVNYIVTGAVTEYGQSRSGGGGGGVDVGKVGYHAAVDIRIVDAVTGRIIFADSASQSKSSLKVKVFGFGGGESFNEKLATEAMREAIHEVALKISATEFKASGRTSSATAAASSETSEETAGRAVVADIDGDIITLNKGAKAGFNSGETLTVSRKDRVIKDPATGKVLKVKYKAIGKIKLKEVAESYSEGTVVSGSDFKVGDIIR
ncbi:MAG: hypothetical protein JXR80_07755 [Deltaproteobacteria bacterium]|nr:hypothetical protein [Deltaproteobacteria bacterium]